MESYIIYYIVAFIVLLVLSAFFSSSETALFSLSQLTLQKLTDEKRKGAQRIAQMLKTPQKLLNTILFGNTLVNAVIVSVAALTTWKICNYIGFSEIIGLLIETVVITLVLLICSEITPKVFALAHAEKYSLKLVGPLTFFTYLFFPVTFFLTALTRGLTRALGGKVGQIPIITEDEMKSVVDMGQEKGSIEEDEKEMIKSLFSFSSTSVKEIMVPRIDMKCISSDETISEALKLVKEAGFSRIPMYEDTIDNIQKILYAKDLLKYINHTSEDKLVKDIAREAYFIPASKKIDDLLKEFKREKIHIAIIVDEYGGTAGMVTMEDILEEIVGEIQDEYDEETPLYSWVRPNTLLVNAKIDLTDLHEVLGVNLPENEGYETLGGFIHDIAERMPEEKEEIMYNDLKFIINKVENKRIVMVEIVMPRVVKKSETMEE